MKKDTILGYVEETVRMSDEASTPYRRSLCAKYFALYEGVEEVVIIRRGGGEAIDVHPMPHQVTYVLSTGGRWGRSKQVRLGASVLSRKTTILRKTTNAIA